jgi:lysozyme
MRRLALIATVAACAADPAPRLAETAQQAAVCASGPTIFGIDVSRFQGAIDWQQVAGVGVVYAYIQISRSLTDVDLKFPYNWQHAKDAGILRGAYQRFHPAQDVAGQANLFLEKLGPYQSGDLPPMLDVEDADGLPAATIAERVRQWMDIVEPAVGRKPIIYTGFYFWRDSVGGADFSDHPLWVANYSATCPLVPPAWQRWRFHQYSSTVTLPGIAENTVDVDKFDGTLAELQALGAPPTCEGTCNGSGDPPGPDAGGDDEPAVPARDSGCTAGGGAGWLAGLILIVLGRRRR